MKKSYAYGFAAVLAVGILLSALAGIGRLPAALGKEADAPTAAVAYINDTPVDPREFRLILDHVKAQVASDFKVRFDADASPAFWTASYEGEVPMEKAKQMALEQVKRVKTEQLLARQYGLLDDLSYSAFLDQWRKENERRAEAVKRNQVIYGPKQYDEWGYYMYRNTNLVLKLKRLLDGRDVEEEVSRQVGDAEVTLVEQVYRSISFE